MKKRQLEKGERGFIVLLGVLSLIAVIASLKLFVTAPKLSGEGTVPLLCSSVMLIMTFCMLFEMRSCPSGFEGGLSLLQKAKQTLAYLFPGKVGIIVCYCIIYAVLLDVLGFIISTFLFLAGSMLTLNSQKKVRALVVSVATLVCIMILFQFIFQVQLP